VEGPLGPNAGVTTCVLDGFSILLTWFAIISTSLMTDSIAER
jgi:hypothetical protein